MLDEEIFEVEKKVKKLDKKAKEIENHSDLWLMAQKNKSENRRIFIALVLVILCFASYVFYVEYNKSKYTCETEEETYEQQVSDIETIENATISNGGGK